MMNLPKRFCLSVCLLTFCVPAWSAAPQLGADTAVATAGYFRLEWNGKENLSNFTLEESQQASFSQTRTLYQGPDTARIISGRANGDYYYRVRNNVVTPSGDSAWSDVVHVQVKHHPLSRAFMFFFIGAIVFVAILAVIFVGNRQTTK